MKRYVCLLTIAIIIICLGLYKLGIALFEYKGKTEGEFIATILSIGKESKYMNSYIAKIDEKQFILYVKKSNTQYEIGDILKFQGKFSKGEEQRNYGGFDYDLYLKTKKIYGTFKADNENKIGKEKGLFIKWKQLIFEIQKYIENTFNDNLKKENAGILTGLLIGKTEGISDKTIEEFRDASLTHVLAISGSNFMYIVLMFNFINKKVKRKRLGEKITIIGILFFMELTGNTASVVRAGTMSILLLLSKLLHRKYDFWTSLSLSTLIQIIYNPYVLFDLGLILSYGGVLGLVLFYTPLQRKIKSKLISATVSANILIIPVMMYNFNTLSLSFVISNILSSILIEVITILGIVSIIFKFKFIFIVLDILLSLLNWIVQICAHIPFAKIYVTTPSIISVLFFYALLYVLLYYKKIKKVKSKIAIILTIIIIANLNYEVLIANIKGELLINFVDVGQGDCTLIRMENKTMLVDSGGSTDESYDIGKNILLPYLLDRKINVLDYIMISHFDADHCQGFLAVLENIKVKNIILAKQAKTSELYKKILNLAKKNKTNLLYVKTGQTIKFAKAEFEIIFPEDKLIDNNPMNNNSIVCRLKYNSFSMLFTGDIEKEAEEIIVKKNINLKSTILKVEHHGSKTSTIDEFLKKASPKIALIGVGKDNKFGHPSDETIEKLKNINTKIYRTDQMGEISLRITKQGRIII